jgi:thioredoxin reductase (NADPH)
MSNQAETNYDAIIVGGGPAGLSAALWCDELGLTALLLEKDERLGGQLLWTHNEIKNHLGSEAANGRELRDLFVEQTSNRAFSTSLRTGAAAVDPARKKVTTSGGATFSASALILATGVRRRRLDVAGEDEFKGRGIIESGKQNAEAVAGHRVLIVGGGDAALENALILAEKAARVTVAHRRREFRARTEFLEKVKNHPKIELLTETLVEKIEGGERLETVVLKLAGGETRPMAVETLLLRIGVEPNTELFRGRIDLDDRGYIEIDRDCETSVEGVFAVGDVANPHAPTVSSAVGMGATAAKVFSARLRRQI